MLYKTNSTVFIHFYDMWPTHTLYLRLADEKLWVTLSSSFLVVIIFSVSSWLKQGSNLNSIFLRVPLTSLCFQSKFWLEQKAWSLGAVCTPAYSLMGVTLYCVLTLSLTGHPCVGHPPEACAHGHHVHGMRTEQQGTRHRSCISLVLMCMLHVPRDFTYKII